MKLLVIMSHILLEEQIQEAKEQLHVDSIITLPKEIRDIWGKITPVGSLPVDSLSKVIEWIEGESVEGDYVLVQGDFGSTFYIVDYCFKNGRIPIYATTNRKVEEKRENETVKINRVFKRENFRKYMLY